jgi:CHASE3 domain sensor protein
MNRYSVTIEDIATMMRQGEGKRLMDVARVKIKDIVDEEEKLIIIRAEDQALASGFAIMLLLLALF